MTDPLSLPMGRGTTLLLRAADEIRDEAEYEWQRRVADWLVSEAASSERDVNPRALSVALAKLGAA